MLNQDHFCLLSSPQPKRTTAHRLIHSPHFYTGHLLPCCSVSLCFSETNKPNSLSISSHFVLSGALLSDFSLDFLHFVFICRKRWHSCKLHAVPQVKPRKENNCGQCLKDDALVPVTQNMEFIVPCNPQIFYKHVAAWLFPLTSHHHQSVYVSPFQTQYFGLFLMESHLNIWESFPQAEKIVSNSDPDLLGLTAPPNCVIHRLNLFARCSVVNKNYLIELGTRQTGLYDLLEIPSLTVIQH